MSSGTTDYTSFTATADGSVLPLSAGHGVVSEIGISPTRSEDIIGTISGVAATLNTANKTEPTGTGISRNRESATDGPIADLVSDRETDQTAGPTSDRTADPMADQTEGLISDQTADPTRDLSHRISLRDDLIRDLMAGPITDRTEGLSPKISLRDVLTRDQMADLITDRTEGLSLKISLRDDLTRGRMGGPIPDLTADPTADHRQERTRP